jgi:hypothetical protein
MHWGMALLLLLLLPRTRVTDASSKSASLDPHRQGACQHSKGVLSSTYQERLSLHHGAGCKNIRSGT